MRLQSDADADASDYAPKILIIARMRRSAVPVNRDLRVACLAGL
jgi:hypothetical protein